MFYAVTSAVDDSAWTAGVDFVVALSLNRNMATATVAVMTPAVIPTVKAMFNKEVYCFSYEGSLVSEITEKLFEVSSNLFFDPVFGTTLNKPL